MGAFGANSRNVTNSVNLLTLSSERSRNDCGVAKNSNADWISELCYIVCPRTGVLKSSDDTLCNFTRGLSEQRRWEIARQTASRHSASLPVNKLMFCSLPMTLSATSNGDFHSLHLSALLNPVLWDDLQDFDNSDLSLTGRGNHTALKLANTSLNNANTNKATQDTTTLPSTSGWDLPYSRKP